MMPEWAIGVVVMAAVVLLPLVPAFLLFKFLQSTGSAEGPLAGLGVKFSGAAACYLVILLLLLWRLPQQDEHYHTWTVEGVIGVKPATGESDPNLNDLFVRAVPPRLFVMNQGAFSWEIPVVEGVNGQLRFPDLQLDLRGYRGITVPLQPGRLYGASSSALEYDHERRVISVKEPIVLQSAARDTAYVPSKAATVALMPADTTAAEAAAAATAAAPAAATGGVK